MTVSGRAAPFTGPSTRHPPTAFKLLSCLSRRPTLSLVSPPMPGAVVACPGRHYPRASRTFSTAYLYVYPLQVGWRNDSPKTCENFHRHKSVGEILIVEIVVCALRIVSQVAGCMTSFHRKQGARVCACVMSLRLQVVPPRLIQLCFV